MDISRINVRAAADRGSDMHLRDPFGGYQRDTRGKITQIKGDPLYDEAGQPVTLRILGNEASAVQAERRAIEAEDATGNPVSSAERVRRIARVACVGWSGLTMGGEPFPFTPENRDSIVDASEGIQIQILDHLGSLEKLKPGDKKG